MEDHLLIKRCRQGDSNALCRIYDKYRESLLVLAMALTGNANEAEDVLHDVLLSFARNLDTFRLTGKLKAYLAVCVVNQTRNHLKRAKYRRAVNLDQLEVKAASQSGPVSTAVCNEQLHLISQAMIQLSLEQRSVIVLHIHAGMTFRSIAKQQDVP
jgi:RNA polymerase sigma-70 factor, ECF subfamily